MMLLPAVPSWLAMVNGNPVFMPSHRFDQGSESGTKSFSSSDHSRPSRSPSTQAKLAVASNSPPMRGISPRAPAEQPAPPLPGPEPSGAEGGGVVEPEP